MNIDHLIDEFNVRRRISVSEFHRRYPKSIAKIKHLFFLRKILFWRFLIRGKFYYELVPLDFKIIKILRKKEVFSREYVRNRLGLTILDFKTFLLEYDYKLVELENGSLSLQKLPSHNDIPCLRDIEFCAHIEQCYLSYKCKAAQRFLQRQAKNKIKPTA